MLQDINYLIAFNILSTFLIIIQRNREVALVSLIMWITTWCLMLANSPIGLGIAKDASFIQNFLAIGLTAGIVILCFLRTDIGFIGIIATLPFRIPLEVFGFTLDVRKIFILIVVAIFFGLINKNRSKFKHSTLNIPVAITFLVISISYFWAANPYDALIRYVFFFAPFAVLYKVIALSEPEKNIPVLVTAVLFFALLLSSYGILTSIKPIAHQTVPPVAPGWKTASLKGAATFSLEQEKENYYQKITVSKTPATIQLYQGARIPEKVKQITLNGKLKVTGAPKAVIALYFFKKPVNSKRVLLKSKQIVIDTKLNDQWQTYNTKVKVPKKANILQTKISLKSAQPGATLSVKQLNVKQVKLKNPKFGSGGYITQYIRKIRTTSVFWDPNVFAKYLVFVLLIASITLFEAKRFGMTRALVLVAPTILLSFAALFLTISRSGFLSLLVGLSLLLFSFVLLNIKKLYGILALLFILSLSVFLIVKPPDFAERLNIFGAHANVQEIMAYSGGRNHLMDAGIKIVDDKPLYGFGLGSFSDIYYLYRSKDANKEISESHNSFITIATEQGMIGIVLILWIFCFTAYSYLRSTIRKKQNFILVGGFAILTAFGLQSLFYAYLFEDPYTWVVLGLLSSSLISKPWSTVTR